MAMLNSYNRVHIAHEPKIYPIWHCIEKFADPCSRNSGICYIPPKHAFLKLLLLLLLLSLLLSWAIVCYIQTENFVLHTVYISSYLGSIHSSLISAIWNVYHVCMGQVPAKDLGFSDDFPFGIFPSVSDCFDHHDFCLYESKKMAYFSLF